jgi:hypothetical protein
MPEVLDIISSRPPQLDEEGNFIPQNAESISSTVNDGIQQVLPPIDDTRIDARSEIIPRNSRLRSAYWEHPQRGRQSFTTSGRSEIAFPNGIVSGNPTEYNGEMSVRFTVPYANLGQLVDWLTSNQHTADAIKRFNGIDLVVPGQTIWIPLDWVAND